jgi:hypothetical protein
MLQDEVIGGLISQIFSRKKDLKLAKYAIHKVLFKLKVELPEGSTIREHLPFYWYNYGPFSDVVESNIDALKQEGVLKEYTTSEEKTILGLEKKIPLPEEDDFEEARKKLNSIVTHVDFFHFNSFVDELYRKYAPCAFMPLFKLDFMNKMEGYVEMASSGQQTLDMFSGSYPDVDKLEAILYDCEAELPSAPLFRSFNASFSSFATEAGRVFDYIREEGENLLYLNEEVLHTAEVTWLTFTKGIRILDVGHDKYYDDRLDRWKALYNKSLTTFYTHIDNFSSGVLTEIEPARLHTISPGDKSKKILSSVIDGYLA